MRKCWCGNSNFIQFGPQYGECRVCKTLVSQDSLSDEQLIVNDDESDFYGKQYWLEHQNDDLGFPDIYTRSRNDLTERNLHWLKTLLKYCLPPAKVVELGCSHGSFVALMQQTGYEAAGVEMSRWVVSFAAETFQIPMYLGPVENLDIPPNSLNVIALMDVLEHLPDPVETLHYCANLLKPGGFLLIQTPEFQEEMSYPLLEESKSLFLEQLKADEHLYLFSQASVIECLDQVGLKHVYFEPAIFAVYDMFLVASKEPLETYSPVQIESALLDYPQGRLALALLDIRERELALSKAMEELNSDRAARLEQIHILTEKLQESDADRAARLDQINTLTEWLKNSQGKKI